MSKQVHNIVPSSRASSFKQWITSMFAATSLLATSAPAAILTPTSIISDSQSSQRESAHLFNGVEMNVTGDPADYTNWSMSPSDDSLSLGEGWMAGVPAANGRWVIADLGIGVASLNTISIWNFNPSAPTYLNRSVTILDVYVNKSLGNNVEGSGSVFDSSGWTLLQNNVAVSVNPSGTTINSPNGLVTGLDVSAPRFVAFEINNVNGGSNPGLGEIQFFGTNVPEPTTLGLFGLGALMLSLVRRNLNGTLTRS